MVGADIFEGAACIPVHESRFAAGAEWSHVVCTINIVSLSFSVCFSGTADEGLCVCLLVAVSKCAYNVCNPTCLMMKKLYLNRLKQNL